MFLSDLFIFFKNLWFLVLMQAVHRHIPIFVRALESSYSELLHIISNPPQGSENLLTQVHILSEDVNCNYYYYH